MTATYTDNLRITKQGDGDNSTTWGQVVNNQIIELFEDAISGVVNIDCTGSSNVNIATTAVNGGTDDARHMILELTGTLGASIQLLLPAVDKLYAIRASFSGGYTINVRPTGGGSGIDFTNGQVGLIYTNGTSIYSISSPGALLAANNLSDLINAATARTNLGLGTAAVLNVGTSANQVVQLDGTGKLPAVDGSQLTGLGSGGTMASQNANNVAITGGTITGITDLAIADGGTGASTAAAARTNLGLGTIATQNASAVAITGGTISGVSFTQNTAAATGKIVIGSITIQWGVTSAINDASSATVTFATAFSAAPYSVQCTPRGAGDDGHPYGTSVASRSATQIQIDFDCAVSSTVTVDWLAIGPT